MKRRDFLKNTAFASTAALVPQFIQNYARSAFGQVEAGKILVIIQLSGGNDGLNTVIPYRNDIYYRERPSLSIPATEVLRLDDQQGLHPAMVGLRELYDQGLLTVLNSVGYPNPDRSHFRSMDIWHTASNSNEHWTTGWLGRYIDNDCTGCANPHHVIEVDDSLSLALKGEQRSGFAMRDPRQIRDIANAPFLQAVSQQGPAKSHEHLDFLYKTLSDTQSSADYLFEQAQVHRSTVDFPKSPFGKDLKRIAELITANTNCRVYYASLSGFDTHANQQGAQQRLLEQYAEGVKALTTDLQQNGLLNEVRILTFSEFGRRVVQNASNGTDHGTANNAFIIGGNLPKPGIFNAAPNLEKLDQGDLFYQIDFRSVYQNLLDHWLEVDSQPILGRKFERLELV